MTHSTAEQYLDTASTLLAEAQKMAKEQQGNRGQSARNAVQQANTAALIAMSALLGQMVTAGTSDQAAIVAATETTARLQTSVEQMATLLGEAQGREDARDRKILALTNGLADLVEVVRLQGLRQPHQRSGRADVLALLAGGQTTVPVTWSSPMPTADYKLDVWLPPALLGKATVTAAKTAEGVALTVKSSALATVAASIQVTAYDLR